MLLLHNTSCHDSKTSYYNLERNSGFIFIYHLSYMLRLAFTDFSLQLLSHSFLHESLHLFFHSLQQMSNRKHHRLIMHIL